MDDWKDEKSKAGLVGVRAFRKTYLEIEKISKEMPDNSKLSKNCRHVRSRKKRILILRQDILGS